MDVPAAIPNHLVKIKNIIHLKPSLKFRVSLRQQKDLHSAVFNIWIEETQKQNNSSHLEKNFSLILSAHTVENQYLWRFGNQNA